MERELMDRGSAVVRTVGDLAMSWSALGPEGTGLRATTVDGYRSLLRSQILPILGDVHIAELTSDHVVECFQDPSGASVSTRRTAYAALVKLLDHGVAAGLLESNVARAVSRPAATVTAVAQTDRQVLLRFLEAAGTDRYELAAWLSFCCGLRRGEILALPWSEVDLEARELNVVRTLTRSSRGLQWGPPKTSRGRRRVRIPDGIIDLLDAQRERQERDRRAAGDAWRSHDLVLTNEFGGTVEPRALSRHWQKWARAAGAGDIGTHAGRRYAANLHLSSGAHTVVEVAAQLGHDPAAMSRSYAAAIAAARPAGDRPAAPSLA